jgi:hypothetical protein
LQNNSTKNRGGIQDYEKSFSLALFIAFFPVFVHATEPAGSIKGKIYNEETTESY